MRYDVEIWRFFTTLIVHPNLGSILFTLFFLCITGSSLEYSTTSRTTAKIYILGGFGGVLFAALCDSDRGVGSSPALYSLIGGYAGFLLVNWNFMENMDEIRCHIICFTIISIFLVLLTSSYVSQFSILIIIYIGLDT